MESAANVVLGEQFIGAPAHVLDREEAVLRQRRLAVLAQRQVLREREVEHEPAPVAVLGDVPEPEVEERELTVMLLVDLSGSEQFGTHERFKAERIADLLHDKDKLGEWMESVPEPQRLAAEHHPPHAPRQ